jgi:hypothetical protein
LDSSIQSHFVNQCVHSKNIFSLADLPAEDETYKKLKKHVESCRQCTAQYAKSTHQLEAMKIFIPKPLIDKESKEVFDREITELFKIFNLNKKAAVKIKLKAKMKLIDSAGIDMLKNLASKSMLKAYVLAGVAYVALHSYFN